MHNSLNFPIAKWCILALLPSCVALFCMDRSLALNRKVEPGGPIGFELGPGLCEARAIISLWMQHKGLPLIGHDIVFDASALQIVLSSATDPNNPAVCDNSFSPFPPNVPFLWELLSRPEGSATTLDNANSLAPTIKPDVIGTYKVKFSACRDQICKLDNAGGVTFNVGDGVTIKSYEQTMTVYADKALRPATEPRLPPLVDSGNLGMSDDEADDKCPGSLLFDDLATPQLVTVNPWSDAVDYVLVEGKVTDSHSSTVDNNLNHHVNDFNTFIKVDPTFNNRIRASPVGNIETEWEWGVFPEKFRPTRGDRASFYGFWVLDCHHTPRSMEIHPPVMSVAHRARAIRLPDRFGTNVYVPGIVSDIWVNQNGGEMTEGSIIPPGPLNPEPISNCSTTGLHQPGDSGACVPSPLEFEANPINREFVFNIYLPANPKRIMEEVGFPVPSIEVELHTAVETSMGGPSAPINITEEVEDGVTFLRVTVDLRNFSGTNYSARIVAGWAYPSPDNWGIRQWKVRLNSLEVYNDADGIGRGAGEWNFWVNINNTDQEWTRLINWYDYVEDGGKDYFEGEPWETGHPNPSLSLGPDLLLFPGQIIWLHADGYEKDLNWEDSLGRMDEFIPQEVRSYDDGAGRCGLHGNSGCADWAFSYDILGGNNIEASLSDNSRRIYDSFVSAASGSGSPVFPDSLAPRDWNHPAQLVLQQGQKPIKLSATKFFHVQKAEVHQIADISSENFRRGVERLRHQQPELLDRFMTELQLDVKYAFRRLKTEDVLADLPALHDALSENLWNKYFGDINLPHENGGKQLDMNQWLVVVIVLLLLILSLGIALWFRRTQS